MAFEQLVSDLTNYPHDTDVEFAPNKITRSDYDEWRKQYTWDALQGLRYGQSFCNRFGLHDNHLYYNTGGIDWADEYIEKTYL